MKVFILFKKGMDKMRIIGGTGLRYSNLDKSSSSVDKESAKRFSEYYNSGSLDLEAAKNGGDTVEISKAGNIYAKVERLDTLFENKDFSGMSETQIFKMIEKAYNREFPDFRANESLNKELYEKVALQRDEQLKKALNIQDNRIFDNKVIELYKKCNGYDGMNNQEINEKINKEFVDDETHLGRALIFCEKLNTGLISKEECRDMIKGMQGNLEKQYCKMAKICRIEDADPEAFGEWKARYYDGEFLPEKLTMPAAEERRMEMLTSFGKYLMEIKPLIDDYMKITDGKTPDDLTHKKDDEDKEETIEKVKDNPTVVKGENSAAKWG